MRTCEECGSETKNPRFCSLSCSTKSKNKKSRENKISQYYSNPKKCLCCSTILSYEYRIYKYCSKSCAASHGSKGRKISEKAKENIRTARLSYLEKHGKLQFPYCPVEFIICKKTGKPYCNKNERGYRRQQSPYVLTEKQKYYDEAKFRFNVYHYPEHFDLSLIEQHGWYTCPGKKRKHYQRNINGVSRDHIISISEGFRKGYDPELLAHPANCKLVLHYENKKKSDKSGISINELKERIKKFGRR